MSANKAEKFRLNIVGADEDVPRVMLAYGRGCGGEVAFVMRPRDNTALLVHQIKKEPAKVWGTDLGLAPSHAPELEAAPADAVAEIRRMKANPPASGPATLKGKWAGNLFCDDGTPRIVLERRVASYGILRLASKADGRWVATFERLGKWFSQAKQESVERSGLAEAITAGMGIVIGLVSEACSFRDTRRRNTVDAEYGSVHPYVSPAQAKDPTERFQAKSTFRAIERADGWAVINDVGSLVAMFGAKEKGKATKHASALTRGKGTASTVSADLADSFGLGGMPGVNAVPSLAEIPMPKTPSCPLSVAQIAASTEKEAQALEGFADSLWGTTEAADLLGRAGKLLRHAEALVKSPLCSGKEQKMAWEDLRRGAEAYTQAREAFERGEKPDIVTTLRRISERVSLAAARAAKSCAAGQQKTGLVARSPDQIADGITCRETPVPPTPRVSMQPVWPPAAAPMGVATVKRTRAKKAADQAVDPAKDQALVNAFADAIKEAASQMGGAP